MTIQANNGYKLPSAIEVTGASYTYDDTTGVIALSNPSDNITITAVCTEVQQGYNVVASVTNGIYSGPTHISSGETKTATITPGSQYGLPSEVTVTNATFDYSDDTGVITISNPTGTVSITVVCLEQLKAPYIEIVNNSPTMISFSILGASQQAEDGMTWADWVDSEYTDSYWVIGNKVSDGGMNVCYNSVDVAPTDLIVADRVYSKQSGGGNTK